MVKFKTENGEQIDIFKYSKDILSKNPGILKIHVGCDSQNKKNHTIYATVIAYRIDTRGGVHYVFSKEIVKKIKDKWSRLWSEVERVANICTELRNNGIPVHFVELDFNSSDVNAGSHSMVAPGVGYLKGLGFDNIITKPQEQIAVKAADHIIN